MNRFIAISLLTIFIAGQVNLTWASHYCMGFNVKNSLMLGQGKLNCGMGEMMDCDEENAYKSEPIFAAPDCCSNEYASSDADDNFSKTDPITNAQVLFALTYVETFLSFNPQGAEQNEIFDASPPLIQADFQVLYQSFLL